MQTSVRNVGLSAPQTLYAQQFPDFMNCGTLQQSFCAAHNPISVPLKSLLTSGQLEILTAAGPSIAREQRCAAASEIFRSTGFPLNSAIWYQTVIKTFLSWRFLDLTLSSFSSQCYLFIYLTWLIQFIYLFNMVDPIVCLSWQPILENQSIFHISSGGSYVDLRLLRSYLKKDDGHR